MKGYIEEYEEKGRVLITGGMNARVGDGEVEGVVGKFGVSEMNEDERKIELST